MNLLIVGAGGFATEIEELAKLCGFDNIAFLDDHPDKARCKPIIGSINDMDNFVEEWSNAIVALGNNKICLELHNRLKEKDLIYLV